MEEKKGLLDYMGEIFVIFGISLLVITVTCWMVGEEAKEYSTMFALGREGIPLATIFEYLLSSTCVTLLRFLFFSEVLFKKMSITKRTGGMLISVIAMVGIFAFVFGWFPVDDPKCWAAFFICFTVCFVGGFVVTLLRERGQNQRLAEALKRWKEKQWEEERRKEGQWEEEQRSEERWKEGQQEEER